MSHADDSTVDSKRFSTPACRTDWLALEVEPRKPLELAAVYPGVYGDATSSAADEVDYRRSVSGRTDDFRVRLTQKSGRSSGGS
ncbi:hypothetical protein CYV19_00520 [Natronobacterium gregoryi SP2]|uniref:Uncharacterized protein n=1 Tax=Natronobacterium gregoryi (strain ATCC 43098 / DSM 3393 / CCM 3738 / CIP 104747 / IAM 13177 / JCM 8860 / NBRC 102187 / NCIMB 2189 / SP2) TaxID=797304 RepID=L9XSZ1_NATGS|nr:hypothetical protein C490_15949 [Natronobacterium gregoryi SP2]PLK22192.1 hypothetical protein CYV19_00520 [Natronobacterium gregoryi SP2]